MNEFKKDCREDWSLMNLLTTILILSLLAPRSLLQGPSLIMSTMYERILAYHEQVNREIETGL